MPGPYTIAHVTPYPWESGHEVNEQVRRVCAELAARGHRVLIVAPSGSQALVREGRRAVRNGEAELFGDGGEPRVLAVGEALPPLPGRARSGAAVPLDVARTVQELFERVALDICHVHEPFAPSVASVALRHSRALNVGSFHAPAERVVSTQVARKVVQLVFGRLDARLASFDATRTLLQRFFPGDYRVVPPGADALPRAVREDGPVTIGFVDIEERAAMRLFIRALRRLPVGLDWRAIVLTARGPSSSTPLRADLRERVEFVAGGDEAAARAGADVLVAASDGSTPQPGLVLRAQAAGAVPLVSRLPVYEEVTGDGERGVVFEVRDPDALAAGLAHLVANGALRERLRAATAPRPWSAVADDLEDVYARVADRRHDGRGDPELRDRLRTRALIDVDLHMHTDHSGDCATPVEVLLQTAKAQGLGAIASTSSTMSSRCS